MFAEDFKEEANSNAARFNYWNAQATSIKLMLELINRKPTEEALKNVEDYKTKLLLGVEMDDLGEPLQNCLLALAAVRDCAASTYFSPDARAFKIIRTKTNGGLYEAALIALKHAFPTNQVVQTLTVEVLFKSIEEELARNAAANPDQHPSNDSDPLDKANPRLELIAKRFNVKIERHNHLNQIIEPINPSATTSLSLFYSVFEG